MQVYVVLRPRIDAAIHDKPVDWQNVTQCAGLAVGKGLAIQAGAKIGESLYPHYQGKQKGAFAGAVVADGVIDTLNSKHPSYPLKPTDFIFNIIASGVSNIMNYKINALFNDESSSPIKNPDNKSYVQINSKGTVKRSI